MLVTVSMMQEANFTFNPKSQMIEYGGNQYDLTGIITDLGKVSMNFKIGGFYDEIGGKFSKVYGNVAIVDCKYFANSLFPALKVAIRPLFFADFALWQELTNMINDIQRTFNSNGLTMCDFPFEYDGVLKNQASYYLENYDTIRFAIGAKGKVVSDALGLNANYTMLEPLVK